MGFREEGWVRRWQPVGQPATGREFVEPVPGTSGEALEHIPHLPVLESTLSDPYTGS